MEVENLKSGGIYHLGGLKNKKNLNKKISFSILPHLALWGIRHNLHFISKSYSLELFPEA